MNKPSTLNCPDCGYVWRPRKNTTRYPRQCPRCKHVHFAKSKIAGNTHATSSTTTATISQPITIGSRWPKVVYDLVGISDSSSPENALQKAFELYRRMLPYKYNLGLESPEAVFEYLEKKAAASNRTAVEAQERLQRILNHPKLIFYEIGTDLTAPDWYDALRKEGYKKDFLEFINEIIEKHFEERGVELGFREN